MEFGTDSAAAPEIVVPRIFSALSEAERRDLVSMARRRAFANGEEVFREGDPGDSLFVIERGQAIVSTDYKDKTIMFAMLDAGDFFGEMALLTKRPRTATVTAFGDLEVYELSKESVKSLVDRQPKVLKDLVNFYYSRVKESREILKGG
jgi:CRP-like cAMP-binding protein